MAYHIDGTDIVIDGWENGISNNPYEGINDMRGVNIISIPGEASVSFAQTNITFSSCTGSVVSADSGTEIVTVTISTGLLDSHDFMAVIFTGASLPGGLSAATPYWIHKLSDTTFQVYSDPGGANLVNITSTGTGTFASINIGEITYFDKVSGVALDKNGRAWYLNTFGNNPGYFVYLGNDVSSTAGLIGTAGNGLIYFKGYLFLFYDSRICYMAWSNLASSTPSGTWVNEWNPTTGAPGVGVSVFNTAVGTHNHHDSLIGVNDGTVYITDAGYIASLFEKPGQTFDPTNTATYSWAKQAISSALPSGDIAQCLAELGSKLLIGGQYNAIYPWDRVSSGPNNAILISENNIVKMITVNTNTYIFAGRRGRIYFTNGTQAEEYAKVPDHLSGTVEPNFTWQGVAYNKNQLYFGILAQNNFNQAYVTNYNGLWAIDITTEVMRVPTLQSTSSATACAIFANPGINPGYGLLVAWKTFNSSGTTTAVGIDTSSFSGFSFPYYTYTDYIITDIIPVGQYLKKRSFENLEWKLGAPMANTESIKISYRSNISSSFIQVGEWIATATYLPMSDFGIVNFDQLQWVQFKIETVSTASSPSYVRLKELRLR